MASMRRGMFSGSFQVIRVQSQDAAKTVISKVKLLVGCKASSVTG